MNQEENPYRSPTMVWSNESAARRDRDLVARGRILYLGIVLFYLLVDIGLVLAVGGEEPDGVRIGLGLAVFYAGWRGHGWAIALLFVGFALGTLFGLIAVFESVSYNVAWPLWLGLGVTTVYAVITWAFIRSKSLNAFFKHQSRRRRETPDAALPEPDPLEAAATPEAPDGAMDLVTIATFDYRTIADVCRAAITQAGIPVFLADDNVIGGYNFLWSNALGGIKVQVARRDVEKALQIVEDARAHGSLAAPADEHLDAPSGPISFACEECGKPISFPAERRGKVEVCPKCGEYVDVPE